MCAVITKFDRGAPTVFVCVKITETAGPRGPSGRRARSPVDAAGIRGADPATASRLKTAPARRSKPAAAWKRSVTARVRHHSACLICHVLIYLLLMIEPEPPKGMNRISLKE